MKQVNKLLSLALAVMLVMALFSGCGAKEEATTETATTESSETTAEATPAVEETTEVAAEEPAEEVVVDPRDRYEAIDMGGRTIRFSAWWQVLPYSDMAEPDPATALPEDIAKYENLKRVEEKYNVKIEYIEVPWGELQPKLTTSVLAGEPYTDIAFLPMTYVVPAIVNDLAMPLSEVVSENSDVINDNIAVNNVGTIIDDEYEVNAVGVPVNGTFMMYNKTMVEDLGLEDPMELYNNDPSAWNWDKFLEYAKAATKDNDGDGNMDTYGLCGFVSNISDQLVIANGSAIYNAFEGKQGLDDPKTIEALEFLNQLYNVDKVVDTTGELWDWDYNFNRYKDGTSLFFPGYSWMLSGTELPYEYSLVPFPMGPSNDTGNTWAAGYDGFIIPKGVEDPQAVYQILEELLWFFGAEPEVRDDSTMEWCQTLWLTQEDVDMSIKISGEQGQLELSGVIPNYPFSNVVGNIVTGDKTVAQAVEENIQIAQDAIDAMMGGGAE